jgi:hypothetical protein
MRKKKTGKGRAYAVVGIQFDVWHCAAFRFTFPQSQAAHLFNQQILDSISSFYHA